MTSEGFSTATAEVPPFVREFSLAGRQLREIDLPSYVDPVFGDERRPAEPRPGERRGHPGRSSPADGLRERARPGRSGQHPHHHQRVPAARRRAGHRCGGAASTSTATKRSPSRRRCPQTSGSAGSWSCCRSTDGSGCRWSARSRSVRATRSASTATRWPAPTTSPASTTSTSAAPVREAGKELVLDLDDLDLTLDNIEGMTLGSAPARRRTGPDPDERQQLHPRPGEPVPALLGARRGAGGIVSARAPGPSRQPRQAVDSAAAGRRARRARHADLGCPGAHPADALGLGRPALATSADLPSSRGTCPHPPLEPTSPLGTARCRTSSGGPTSSRASPTSSRVASPAPRCSSSTAPPGSARPRCGRRASASPGRTACAY